MKSEYWDPYDNYLSEGGVTVAEFQTEEDCDFASYRLREQGIRCGVLLPENRMDLRWPQLRVSPDNKAAAQRILARPASAAERKAFSVEPEVSPFVAPRCPSCESQETILESVGSGNVWRCSRCEESWIEIIDIPESPE